MNTRVKAVLFNLQAVSVVFDCQRINHILITAYIFKVLPNAKIKLKQTCFLKVFTVY